MMISDDDVATMKADMLEAVHAFSVAETAERAAKEAFKEASRKREERQEEAERALRMYDRLLAEARARNVAS